MLRCEGCVWGFRCMCGAQEQVGGVNFRGFEKCEMRMGLLTNPLGWVDTVGDKVGRLLADKSPLSPFRSSPNKHAPLPAHESDPQENPAGSERLAQNSEQKGRVGVRKDSKEKDPDFEGPDTSSLSAFLLNLLSCTEAGVRGVDEIVGSSRNRAQANPGTRALASSSANQSSSLLEAPSNVNACGEVSLTGERGERGRTYGDDEYEADWLLVDEHDKESLRPLPGQATQALNSLGHHLPAMSDESCLLSESLRGFLHPALPTLAKGRQWVLLYSTEKHGMSLLTLYRNSNILAGPCLLVGGDRQGAVFGSLMTAPLVPTPKKKYQGTNESFVFTNAAGYPEIFRPTGLNRYYVLCTLEALAIGGGSHFALHVDADLLNGSSGVCETYGSPCLAHSEEFILKSVELWGFAHASSYPRHVKDLEDVPNIRSW